MKRKRIKNKKNNRRAFTLIELLAVIIILGILLVIAVPSISNYIIESRKDSYIASSKEYINSARNLVNSGNYDFYDSSKTYYLPIECLKLENTNKSPFGEWVDAYVVISYTGNGYNYYWTSVDDAHMGILLTDEILLNRDSIIADFDKVSTNVSVENKRDIIVYEKTCSFNDSFRTDRGKFNIQDGEKLNFNPNDYIPTSYMTNYSWFSNSGISKTNVSSIEIVGYNTPDSDAVNSWDISQKKDGSVMAWTVGPDSNGMYKVYLGSKGGIKAPTSSNDLFSGFSNISSIDVSMLDTSNVTSMRNMFSGDLKLKSIDVSNFDTSKVTDMYSMFSGLGTESNLDMDLEHIYGLENFDTSNVTNMARMFDYCSNLYELNVSHFNTSKVKDMSYMFSGWYKGNGVLKSLDLSNFDTRNVTTMNNMFGWDSKLTDINLSSFDTSNVTNMSSMFFYDSKITSLDLSNFTFKSGVGISDMLAIYNGNLVVKDQEMYDLFVNNLSSIDRYNHLKAEKISIK